MTPALVRPPWAAFALLCFSPPALERNLGTVTLCPSFPYREAPSSCSQAPAPLVLGSGHTYYRHKYPMTVVLSSGSRARSAESLCWG